MTESVLLVGTRKGLWIGRSDSERQHWAWDPPQFLMQEIYATCIDSRGGGRRMLVGATSSHFGPGVFASDDGGRTWSEAVAAPVRFPEKLGASVERIWQIQPGTEPGVVYAGTE
ncbi:MAG TPA: exo-alpha-sialidase, partial [Propionibacteriaceae bacterium]|nr:exo-alpha-sialidase [Propionibacteriaceae bacterium]